MQVQNVIFIGFRGPKPLRDRHAKSTHVCATPGVCATRARRTPLFLVRVAVWLYTENEDAALISRR
jgi:hypothetical protein